MAFSVSGYLADRAINPHSQPLSALRGRLYSSIDHCGTAKGFDKDYQFNEGFYPNVGPSGGIYNLTFNPEGSIMGAACEQNNILLFDPLSRRLVKSIEEAHENGVNCIRFLDNRLFATCSDDTTVKLWDARNLSAHVRTLSGGHTKWVKNVEYISSSNTLVTSGFDGSIFQWDLNKYSDEAVAGNHKKVFYMNALMRMRLTPGGDKMVISTMNGLIVVIHDLDLTTIEKDFKGFKPNMYRLLQLSGKKITDQTKFTRLFKAKRNRIEFLTDFPDEDDAEMISSLQIHPQGWVAVSRNVTADQDDEFCCVHDIHADYEPNSEDEMADEEEENKEKSDLDLSTNVHTYVDPRASGNTGLARMAMFVSSAHEEDGFLVGDDSESDDEDDDNDDDNGEAVHMVEELPVDEPPAQVVLAGPSNPNVVQIRAADSDASRSRRGYSRTLGLAIQEGFEDRVRNRADADDERTPSPESEEFGQRIPEDVGDAAPARPISPTRPGMEVLVAVDHLMSSPFAPLLAQHSSRLARKGEIFRNRPRLTHFIKESNAASGFIKELSFSSDGRLLCSPYGYGTRLLAFSPQCDHLSDCLPTSYPQKLTVIRSIFQTHQDYVLSTAFSPNSYLLVSGCKSGKIAWHQPQL